MSLATPPVIGHWFSFRVPGLPNGPTLFPTPTIIPVLKIPGVCAPMMPATLEVALFRENIGL